MNRGRLAHDPATIFVKYGENGDKPLQPLINAIEAKHFNVTWIHGRTRRVIVLARRD